MESESTPGAENVEFTEEKKEVDFSAAKNFEALYEMIRAAGSIVGSKQTYTAEYLIKAIEGVRRGELTFDHITNTSHLRDTVWRLMKDGGGYMLPGSKTGEDKDRYRVIGLMYEDPRYNPDGKNPRA